MSNDIKISHNGFSFKMTSFSDPYKRWVAERKRQLRIVARQWLLAWAKNVQSLSQIYTPESGLSGNNSLAESIILTPIISNATGTRLKIQVGVADWKSNYDEWYADMFGKKPPWGESSGQLAVYIHENWDTFVVTNNRTYALERAAEKSARNGGARVGGQFLYRGTQDASTNRELRDIGRQLLIKALSNNHIALANTIKYVGVQLNG